MRTVFLFLLVITFNAVSAQNILDSIKVYEYPVKQGVIYRYEKKSSPEQVCANSLSIVSVVTKNDTSPVITSITAELNSRVTWLQ